MSDESQQATEVVGNAGSAVVNYMIPDWFLQSLVEMVNGGNIEFSITLNVGGSLITGLLVGGRKYFEGFASSFAGAFPDQDAAATIKESFSQYGDIYKPDEEGNRPINEPTYIHLRNAKYIDVNGNAIPSDGMWWRGRLSEISGFSLGSFGPVTQ